MQKCLRHAREVKRCNMHALLLQTHVRNRRRTSSAHSRDAAAERERCEKCVTLTAWIIRSEVFSRHRRKKNNTPSCSSYFAFRPMWLQRHTCDPLLWSSKLEGCIFARGQPHSHNCRANSYSWHTSTIMSLGKFNYWMLSNVFLLGKYRYWKKNVTEIEPAVSCFVDSKNAARTPNEIGRACCN